MSFSGEPQTITWGTVVAPIYGPTGLLAEVPGTQTGSPVYRVTDHLGTNVGSLLANGTFVNPVDYMPFGQVFTGNTNDPYMFTSKERDAESGLDYFPARSYSSNMGRWMSPDPSALYFADPSNPQTLNLYSYVGNNPLAFTDPLGLATDCDGQPDKSVVCAVTQVFDWLKNHLGPGTNNNPDQASGAQSSGEPGYDLSPGVNPGTFHTVQAAGIAASRQAILSTLQKDYTPDCPKGCEYEWGGRLLKDKNGLVCPAFFVPV